VKTDGFVSHVAYLTQQQLNVAVWALARIPRTCAEQKFLRDSSRTFVSPLTQNCADICLQEHICHKASSWVIRGTFVGRRYTLAQSGRFAIRRWAVASITQRSSSGTARRAGDQSQQTKDGLTTLDAAVIAMGVWNRETVVAVSRMFHRSTGEIWLRTKHLHITHGFLRQKKRGCLHGFPLPNADDVR